MHGRQRNFGNGYRSGFGMSGSRLSPDRPMRGHGFFGSDHHHQQRRGVNNRGYGRGRGRSKAFQNQLPPPLPPPPSVQRRSIGGSGDVFMDAGRLAAEYLVSQGVLPQTVLSGKWQRGEFQGSSRLQEAARGDVLVAPAADKRRYVDGYNSAGSRNNLQGRRSNRYESDFGRSGSWSERSKAYEDETGDDSVVSGHREEQPLAEDIASSVQRSASGEFMRKREGAGDSESVLDKYSLQDEAQSKTGSSSAGKEILQDCEISKVSEGSCSLSAGSGEMKGMAGGNGGENESQTAVEDASIHQHSEDAAPVHQPCDESFTKSDIDLATLCKFEKVPTRTRSSLTAKNAKLHLSQNIKETSHNPGILEEDQACETRGQSSGKDDSTGIEDLALVQFVEDSKCHRSNSFPNSILRENNEKDSELELPNIHRSYSMGKGGEKRANESSDMEEGAKRQKNWVSLPVSEASDRFNALKASEIQSDEEDEKTISFYMRRIDGAAGKTDNHESLTNTGNDRGKSGAGGYAEEHQLFPASFKMCDLNLGGAADGNDVKRESGQAVGFDLSISSSSKSLDFGTNNNTRMSNGKEIEVIDLDNDDSPEVVKSSNDPGRKQEAAPYMGIDEDVPDYNEGLMMVEYLDSFGNVPPINQGISTATVPQNNDVVLQDREGALGNEQAPNNTDDDSIFMSLGEIPLTFLQTWDQPPARGYEKPF
ncbi:Uncharacterized protein HA466_0036300 [Hirschfeldia incana]|nr:Uncharacterized protein HA466_0036300 [Hirschfeldia incana]